ncbi:MAG: serine/threonine protein kinase [Candidatus Obscuribacterales bacterium]|nr:serine/threonine protein kinase [Candidatus Obscuribacterales bacterium]
MPLQDSFRKKTAMDAEKPQFAVAPMANPPTPEDLRYSMLKAQKEVGRPVVLSWKHGEKQEPFLLTVTVAVGATDPTWILHVGVEEDAAVSWIYTTPDTGLIHSLIAAAEPMTDVPKAVIPESLRPKQEEDVATDNDGAPLPHEEFADKYEILSRLGHGGMGMIFKAKRKDNGQIVALKVLHTHLLNDTESKKRFEQEAAACKDLKHRNLINVTEFGFSKHGQPYMIMEYLEGQSLSTVIEKKGRLESRQFINIFTQICDGLQHAHLKGVVHRDVKPSNVMIIKSDSGMDFAKVLDFGIAKRHMESNHEDLTPTGNVLGSPAYIAPEQCAGAEADPRSDIYSLGCVMYEALAGQPPFVHESAIKVLLMQLSEPPPHFMASCPDANVPVELETIILRCLEKDPNARYQNASELGADLWTYAAIGQRGIIPDPVPESSEAPLAKEAEKAGATIARFGDMPGIAGSGPKPTTGVAVPPPPPIPGAAAMGGVPMPASIGAQLEKLKRIVTFRFKRFRGTLEMDMIWEGLNLARNIQRKDVPITIFLDLESVCLVQKPDLVTARFNMDQALTKKLSSMQAMLHQLIKGGATVIANERWAKRGMETEQQLMPGVLLAGDDEIADLIIERNGSIVDY